MKKELLNLKDKIVVVSKNRSVDEIMEIYNQGFRMFGENRVQELLSKVDYTPSDIQWHLIGHLQRNKVSKVIKLCSLIHSVDSFKLLEKINQESKKQNTITNILLQVNLALEDTKFGFNENEVLETIKKASIFNNILIKGIMVIGPHVNDEQMILNIFNQGYNLYNKCKEIKQHNVCIDTYSAGMSSDYKLALKANSTLLRLGSVMFEKDNL
ncbi:MAG: YggS family pyridoxal phosphate-dependent enzyme [Erysipelotrichia bacterium]|nr:YggS family pyridoxal phosphate-dependent enzyme [Erysipelotrichia bacterium]